MYVGNARHGIKPVWTDWSDRLPTRPYCGDVLADGIYRRPRDAALLYPHVEFNSAGRLGVGMNFDIDTERLVRVLGTREPTDPERLRAEPQQRSWASAVRASSEPVGLLGLSHVKPMLYAADVQRGMTRRLGADSYYVNRIAKNPNHERWRSSWIAPLPYSSAICSKRSTATICAHPSLA